MKTLSRQAPLPSMLIRMLLRFEQIDELDVGELRALIDVEDLRRAVQPSAGSQNRTPVGTSK